jgi:hypothetical protein
MKKRLKRSTPIPSREDLIVYDCLDEQSACEHFLGKSLEEAEALFRENFLYYQEDLMWMGPRAFHYYVRAAINDLRSDNAAVDEAAYFATPIEFRLEYDPQDLLPVAGELAAVCQSVIDQWPRFQEGAEGYGDVLARYVKLRDALEELA